MRSERYGEEADFGKGNVSLLPTLEGYPLLLKRRGFGEGEEGIINKGIGGGRMGNRRIRKELVKRGGDKMKKGKIKIGFIASGIERNNHKAASDLIEEVGRISRVEKEVSACQFIL